MNCVEHAEVNLHMIFRLNEWSLGLDLSFLFILNDLVITYNTTKARIYEPAYQLQSYLLQSFHNFTTI